ncbi:hypothetical protein [Pseudoalteromonas sp. GutCa3]|uniref:hypothetical protein n=1 Tax=Pseudoalteromonas sp. GutCa3 TaxID=888433 RepID=UPI0012FED11F|nr:hypothetical protein [Pseudoalteromonas sp. GutCa3]
MNKEDTLFELKRQVINLHPSAAWRVWAEPMINPNNASYVLKFKRANKVEIGIEIAPPFDNQNMYIIKFNTEVVYPILLRRGH